MTSSASQSAPDASPQTRLAYRFGGRAPPTATRRCGSCWAARARALHEMSRLGVPVPPGFTIPTSVCNDFHREDGGYPAGLRDQVRDGLAWVEERVGTRFGDAENPLLLSVRSGARVSMPGMMDTVLNLGLNDRTVEGLGAQVRRPPLRLRLLPALRRDVQRRRAGREARGRPGRGPLRGAARRGPWPARGVRSDTELSAASLRDLVGAYKHVVRAQLGRAFPDDPWEQLWNAIGAVFDSWNTERAIVYRDLYGYPHDWGTACTVQSMVFGNLGDDCATGVCFTRDPKSGAPGIFGEYLVNAQGEDVVAGVRTPLPIVEAGRAAGAPGLDGGDAAADLRRLGGGLRSARAALPGHAGHRVHGAAGAVVDPADAVGQAHRSGHGARRHRPRRRGADRSRGGAAPHGPRAGGGAAASGLRRGGRRARSSRRAWRRRRAPPWARSCSRRRKRPSGRSRAPR